MRPVSRLAIRRARAADLDALEGVEARAFATDRLSRRSLRAFVASTRASLFVAEADGRIAGYALVLFRAGSALARLYSIAIVADQTRRGIGAALLDAMERDAREHGCAAMRLEVSEHNAPAIARYRKSGYGLFGRYAAYYGDGSAALRFQKRLAPPRDGAARAYAAAGGHRDAIHFRKGPPQ